MPIGTGPSFMSKLGSALPGATNAMAQTFGDPTMSEGVRAAGSMYANRKPKTAQIPRVKGMPNKLPGQQMPLPGMPNMPPPVPGSPGINTMPRFAPPPMPPQMPPQMGGGMGVGARLPPELMGGGMPFGGNTGITGGMGGIFNRFQRMPQFEQY